MSTPHEANKNAALMTACALGRYKLVEALLPKTTKEGRRLAATLASEGHGLPEDVDACKKLIAQYALEMGEIASED